MKYLLYCIFEKRTETPITIPRSTANNPVHILEGHGLAAAFSEIPGTATAHELAGIMEYHRVIESFFNQVAIVPFRFGTVLDEYDDVGRLLEKRAAHYKEILEDLEGCAEMGIRMIINETETAPDDECPLPRVLSSQSPGAGKLFLSSRRAQYRRETIQVERIEKETERYSFAFAGMFKRFRSNVSKVARPGESNAILVSLYFLVPKKVLGRFRQRFGDLASSESARVMLTGPWPPYNFVLPDAFRSKE